MTDQDRPNTRPTDIPDADKKGPRTIQLAPDVAAERELRRYVRKDGCFRKNLEQLFLEDTGKVDGKGARRMKERYTPEQVEQMAIEACEAAGRKIVKDPVTGRVQAEPGWDEQIRVPGFESSEAKAPSAPAGELREKINNQLLHDLQVQNKQLAEQLAELQGKVNGDVKEVSIDDMTVAQLRDYAAGQEIDLGDAKTKAEVRAAIDAELEIRQADEG